MNQSLINTFAAIGVAHIATYIVLFFVWKGNDILGFMLNAWYHTRIGLWFDYQLFRYTFKVLKKKPTASQRQGIWWVKSRIVSGNSKHPYRKKLLALIEWMQAYDPKFNEYIIEQEYKLNNPSF